MASKGNIKKELENFIDKKILRKVTTEDGVTLRMDSNKIRSNTLERPFQCKLCEFTTSCSYKISRHMKRIHLILPAGSSSKMIKSEEDNEKPKIKIEDEEELNIKKEEDEEELYEENPTKKRRNILNDGFECAICGLRSTFKRDLMKHISIIHPHAHIESVEKKDGSQVHLIVTKPKPSKSNPIRCEYCFIIFHDTWKYKVHLRSHTGVKPFECSICELKATSKNTISDHIHRKHTKAEKPMIILKSTGIDGNIELVKLPVSWEKFKCNQCSKLFNDNYTLKSHRNKAHPDNIPYSCNLCDYKAKTRANLILHCQEKHEEEDISNIILHKGKPIRVDSLINLPSCEICNKIFPYKSLLASHLRSHTGDKPFECSICEIKALSKKTIKDHINHKHTKAEKPMIILRTAGINGNIELVELPVSWEKFKCNQCSKLFNDNYTLKSHRNAAHPDYIPYSCNLCDYKAKTRANLILHCQEKHEEEDISNIILHKGKPIKVDSLNLPSCEICNKIFPYKSLLASHTKQIHKGAKQYSCNQYDYSHTKKHHVIYIKEEIPDNKDECMDSNFEEESLDTKVKVEIIDPTEVQ